MDRKTLVANTIQNINNGIFVEIGTHTGDFSEYILDNNHNCTLYCIDPYIQYENYNDAINKFTGDNLYLQTYNKLKSKYGDRVIIIRKFSNDAISSIPEQIDFLYIDGNHQYSYVLDDLKNYYNKVKKGGFIIGDDAVDTDDNKRKEDGNVYIEWSPGCYGNYGVIKAFNDFFKDKKDATKIIGNQYYVEKIN